MLNISSAPTRYPTTEARKSLALRLGLFYDDSMQDWEWEIADATRLREFLDLYEGDDLSDDERFSLMEIIVQSVENSPGLLEENPEWARAMSLLEKNLALHLTSARYWSAPESRSEEERWRVSTPLSTLLRKHNLPLE